MCMPVWCPLVAWSAVGLCRRSLFGVRCRVWRSGWFTVECPSLLWRRARGLAAWVWRGGRWPPLPVRSATRTRGDGRATSKSRAGNEGQQGTERPPAPTLTPQRYNIHFHIPNRYRLQTPSTRTYSPTTRSPLYRLTSPVSLSPLSHCFEDG